jgi:hypothetical protein
LELLHALPEEQPVVIEIQVGSETVAVHEQPPPAEILNVLEELPVEAMLAPVG